MTRKTLLKDILSSAWVLSALAVVCTVFIVDPDLWNGTVTGKYFWFFLSQTIFTGFTLLNVWLRKKKGSVSMLEVLVLLFIAYCSINHLTRSDGYEIKFYLLLFLGAFYFCARILLDHIKYARTLLPVCLVAAGLVESIVGLRQLYGLAPSHHGLYRITGDFFNPGPFSGFVALTVPLAVYYALSFGEKAQTRLQQIRASFSRKAPLACIKQAVRHEKNVYIPIAGISILNIMAALLVIPAAMSRSAWLAIIAGTGVVFAYRLYGRSKAFFQRNKKRSVLISVAAIIIAASAFAGIYNLKRGSADGRLFLWKVASGAIAEKPVFGYGLGNFAGAYGQAQYGYFVLGVDEKEAITADCPAYAFNEFIQIGVEQGLVGLVLFLGIIIIAVASCIKSRGKAGILGAIVAVLVFGFTSYPLSVLPICIASTALLALATGRGRNTKFPFLPVLLLLIFTGSLYFVKCERKLFEGYHLRKSLSLIKSSKYNDITNEYRQLYVFFSRHHDFMFDYGKALSDMKRYAESNEILLQGAYRSSDPMFYNSIGNNYLALGETGKAEEYYWKAYYTLPNRLYPLYLLTKLYHETGQDEKAKEMARRLLEKEPKVMSTAVREMKDYARIILSE